MWLLLSPPHTHQLRHWVAAERGRVLDVARKVIARFQHERKQEDKAEVRKAFQLLLRNGTDRRPTLLGDSKASAKTPDKASANPRKKSRVSRRRRSSRERATAYLHRSRSLRSFYVPVPRWALAMLVVPALACCVYIWSRIAAAGRCDKSEVVGGAPCIVPTFVRHREFMVIIFVVLLFVVIGDLLVGGTPHIQSPHSLTHSHSLTRSHSRIRTYLPFVGHTSNASNILCVVSPLLQPVFDPRLGSSADTYCPCSFIVFREQLNSSGRCDDAVRNKTRQSLIGVAEAAEYVSVVFVATACRETVSVLQRVVRDSAEHAHVLGLVNLPATSMGGTTGGEDNTSSAWGEVFNEIGKTKNLGILDLTGMRGSASHTAFAANVGRLENLRRLKVSETGWRDPIPSSAGRLTQLRDLIASDNPRMAALPKGLLDGLGAMTALELVRNRLTEIPSLVKVTSLVMLDLRSNRLMQAPDLEMNVVLKYLYVLYLGMNPYL